MVGPGRHIPHDRPYRALDAGIQTKINCIPSARPVSPWNDGELEVAQQTANHESVRTIGLYNRRNDQGSLDEVRLILIQFLI